MTGPYHGPGRPFIEPHRDQPNPIRICPNPECEGDVSMGDAWRFCPLCGARLEVFTPPPDEVEGHD